jgi:hypothetical protein
MKTKFPNKLQRIGLILSVLGIRVLYLVFCIFLIVLGLLAFIPMVFNKKAFIKYSKLLTKDLQGLQHPITDGEQE